MGWTTNRTPQVLAFLTGRCIDMMRNYATMIFCDLGYLLFTQTWWRLHISIRFWCLLLFKDVAKFVVSSFLQIHNALKSFWNLIFLDMPRYKVAKLSPPVPLIYMFSAFYTIFPELARMCIPSQLQIHLETQSFWWILETTLVFLWFPLVSPSPFHSSPPFTGRRRSLRALGAAVHGWLRALLRRHAAAAAETHPVALPAWGGDGNWDAVTKWGNLGGWWKENHWRQTWFKLKKKVIWFPQASKNVPNHCNSLKVDRRPKCFGSRPWYSQRQILPFSQVIF